jgi:RNA polymerase sigma-54 factor
MLGISQKLSQQQKLSPQQIQYQKLLQLNTLALEQRVKTELELNPILEEDLELREEGEDQSPEEPLDDDLADEFEVEDYLQDDEYYDDPSYGNRSPDDEDRYFPVAPARETLRERLLNQLDAANLDERLRRLGEEIIGSLDDDGYLNRPLEELVEDLAAFESVEIEPEAAEKTLKLVQSLDPVGCGARSLQECLIVQLELGDYDPYYSYLARETLAKHFDEFVKKRYDALREKMDLSEETLKEVVDLIRRLDPKPGESDDAMGEMNQITPDFLLEKNDDEFTITLNDRAVPSVTLNKQYLSMLEKNKGKRKKPEREKNTYKFLREKFESAKWFIACVQQRRETLMNVMRTILEKQYEFFEKGPKYLKPMIYKDVAEEIEMDVSTISRVVNGKYVESPMGVHELKYFFSEGLTTDSGEEVSNKRVKERIREIVEGEDKRKPLSDDKIAAILKEEGVQVARRTVAKYREQLRLPVARLRKRL